VVTARQRYLIRKYEKAHGILGKVAGRYIAAGYSVELNHPTRFGAINIIARKEGQILAIDVITERSKLNVDSAKVLVEKARLIKAKPILFAYGFSWVEIPEDLRKFCEENDVKLRVVKELKDTY
jgi:predicted RecB family endonuclease